MVKNVLAIVSSPRRGGNTEALVDRFTEGAKEAGHEVETVFLRDKKIAPCIACEACLRNGGTCVQKDDMAEILKKIIAADVIVLSSPVYYYSVCGQLKVMIDRTLAGQGKMKNKEFYFITTAADGVEAQERTMNDLQGFADCVPGSVVKGEVRASAFHVGDIKGNPALEKAYQYGRNC
ncbi:MAG: flavodoxin family protein [Eubacteriales bacterium]|nr:flavodoxin family protein [Eubacteriales bacterium]